MRPESSSVERATSTRKGGGSDGCFPRGSQALALYPANSIFVRGYLTTPGQDADEARRMIEEMGFEVEAAISPQPGRAAPGAPICRA